MKLLEIKVAKDIKTFCDENVCDSCEIRLIGDCLEESELLEKILLHNRKEKLGKLLC